MKLLLIGFSEQNANLLSFLIQQNFKGIQCDYVERNLTTDLRFALPTLTDAQKTAQGMIIDLGGVGMLSFQDSHKQTLTDFTQNYPTLLTTRMPIDVWQDALANVSQYLYIQSPYNKDGILPILQNLIKKSHGFNPDQINLDEQIATKITADVPKIATHTPKPATTVAALKQPLFDNTIVNAPDDRQQAVVSNILLKYFNNVYHAPMLKELAKLCLQNEPFLLRTSRYEVLIAPDQNLAVSSNIARVLDYFTVAKNHDEFAKSITVEILNKKQYLEELNRLSGDNGKKYNLNTLLWQIYQTLLPDDIETTAHNLQIKLKFMPNLADIKDIPNYVQAILASCLSTPKSLGHLYVLFSEAPPSIINRLYLLSVLSNVADLDVVAVLKADDNISLDQGLELSALNDKNDGINKAGKAGFFKRLLNKLAF
jgi:hypothetical protein